jgi:nitrogen fixation protein FixH
MNTSSYRWFPHGLFAAMGIVFAVNAYMVYSALHTFPGVAGTDGFDLSNSYNRVLETTAQQAALGWRIEADLDETRHPVLRLTDRSGAPLTGAAIDARAERPLGPPETTVLTFQPADAALYHADAALHPGQWDVLVAITSGDSRYTTTRRIVVQ